MKISLFIAPFVMARLGNLINIVLKQVNYMAIYVVQYGFFQILFLVLTYTFWTKDILLAVVWAGVLTKAVLFMTNIFLNYKAVSAVIVNNKTEF